MKLDGRHDTVKAHAGLRRWALGLGAVPAPRPEIPQYEHATALSACDLTTPSQTNRLPAIQCYLRQEQHLHYDYVSRWPMNNPRRRLFQLPLLVPFVLDDLALYQP